ncbi:MAG: hypothetical protein AMXMBFR58_16000 [Phycisphaerae bacterium]
MDPARFVATMRSWVEHMEARDFEGASHKALDIRSVGQPLAEQLPFANEQFGLEPWCNKRPEELLDCVAGFLTATAAVMSKQDQQVGGQEGAAVHSNWRSTMDEQTAEHLAAIVGGESWQSGGGIYVVTVYRDDGSLVVFSGDAISEYESDEAFDAGHASKVVMVSIPETDDLYVIVDLKGSVYYRDDKMERGWRYEEDALHEARAWESRGEGRFSVVRQSDVPA